jgi:ketosteroid isomerase-like protein
VGRDAAIHSFEQIMEPWGSGRLEPLSFIDAGDRVVVRHLWHGGGQGPDPGLEFTTVATHRQGKVVLLEYFWDHAQALETLGLADQGTRRENVDIVRRWLGLSSGEDWSTIAGFWDAAADYYPPRKFPETQPLHGIEEIASRNIGSWAEGAFSSLDWEVRFVIAAGDDRVLASVKVRAEGRGSGMDVDGDLYCCYWLRHGRFLRVEDHATLKGALSALGLHGETLEAAGLSQQDAHSES